MFFCIGRCPARGEPFICCCCCCCCCLFNQFCSWQICCFYPLIYKYTPHSLGHSSLSNLHPRSTARVRLLLQVSMKKMQKGQSAAAWLPSFSDLVFTAKIHLLNPPACSDSFSISYNSHPSIHCLTPSPRQVFQGRSYP